MIVANLKPNYLLIALFASSILLFNACSKQEHTLNATTNNFEQPLVVNSECKHHTVFDDSIPAEVSYFEYQGKMIKFEPDPDFFSESQILLCLNTNKGLMIVGQGRTHPSESLAQINLLTYLYDGNNLNLKKRLNKKWSCIPDSSYKSPFDKKNMSLSIRCKDKKPGNENIGSSFDEKYKVNIL